MNLPVFDIPVPNLGFDIPVLMHPPLVHFAIVIPVFILILEIINIFMRRRGLTVTTFVFFTLLIVIFFAAFVTGKTDGSEAWDMLTKAGQADLKEHKLIGIYLLIASVVVVFLKLFAMALRTWWMKLLYLLVLIGFVGAVLYQGKEGGELVFKHGANNERVLDLSNEIDDLNDEIDELKEAAEEAKSQEATEAPKAEPAKEESTPEAKEPKEETPAPAPEKEETKQENTAPAAEKSEESAKPAATENNITETVTQKASETAEAVKQNVKESADAVTEKAAEVTQKATDTAKDAVKSAKEAGSAVLDAAKKMVTPETAEH